MSLRRFVMMIFAAAAILHGQTTFTFQGHVFAQDGSRLPGATVTFASGSVFVAVSESGADPGKYTLSVPRDKYTVTVEKKEYRAEKLNDVPADANKQIDFILKPDCDPCNPSAAQHWWDVGRWGTPVVVLAFLLSIWLVRWHNIARANREMLRAQIDNAEVRFQSETGQSVAQYPHLKKLLDDARASIGFGSTPLSRSRTLIDFFFWTRGQEIAAWTAIHEFQRDSIKIGAATQSLDVRARLQAVELDLLDIDKTHAKTLASNIKDALANPKMEDPDLRALLEQALTYVNDEDVNTYSQLVGWQTKAVWLAGVGCTLVVVLSYAVGNPVLFIVGAAGGYLSRLARTLKRADVPTDYGASWTTLFLSPIVGALSGWFGILLIVLLSDSKIQVFGGAFQAIQWCRPEAPFTLGMAFALGFSERLFDQIISSLEDKVDGDKKAATKPQPPTSSPTAGAAPKQDQGDPTKGGAPGHAPAPGATIAPGHAPAPGVTPTPGTAPALGATPAPGATPADPSKPA
jgi:hypothetical protein